MTILGNGKPDRRPARGNAIKFEKQRDLLTEDLLSEEEKEELRLQAREDFLKERKKKQADQVYADFLAEERRGSEPQYDLVPVFLRLPGSALYIMLDGKQYYTDTTYNDVPQPVAHVLMEQATRAWGHEEQTEVRDSRGRRRWQPPPGIGFGNYMDNRQPRNLTLSSAEVSGAIAGMHATMQGNMG